MWMQGRGGKCKLGVEREADCLLSKNSRMIS